MRSFLVNLTSIALISASVVFGHSLEREGLDPKVPIYLGDIFWPPSMTFIAWLPNEASLGRDASPKRKAADRSLDWCYDAVDVTEGLFNLNGVNNLRIHDYFREQAYITREGKRFADCFVTPLCTRIGACEGKLDYDCAGGHKFTGPGNRRWVCWISSDDFVESEGGPKQPLEQLTGAEHTRSAEATGTMESGSLYGNTYVKPTASV